MKALIAMSGGVDSSVAAYLIKQKGIDLAGGMMLLNSNTKRDCVDAADVCKKIGIPFKIYDFSKQFKDIVISDFVQSSERGETPNPGSSVINTLNLVCFLMLRCKRVLIWW